MAFFGHVHLREHGAMTIKQRDRDKGGNPTTGYGKPEREQVIGPEMSANGRMVISRPCKTPATRMNARLSG